MSTSQIAKQRKKLASLDGNHIRLHLPWSIPHLPMIGHIKAIPGAKYDREKKIWKVPLNKFSIVRVQELGFDLTGRLLGWLHSNENKIAEGLDLSGLKKKLFPFQEKGVQFLQEQDGRALLADEQGLGKTITSLSYLHLHPELRPAVIISPASLKLNWKEEAEKLLSDVTVEVLSGQRPYATSGDILIINYDILIDWASYLSPIGAKILIVDEAHFCKSHTAQRTRGLLKLARAIEKRKIIALTGTPVISRPIEFFTILNLIAPETFPSRWEFAKRYCGLKHTSFGWDFNGSSNSKELHQLLTLNGIMLRRVKKDVLPELPNKLRSYIPIELAKKDLQNYVKARDDFKNWLKEKGGPQKVVSASGAMALVKIEYLKQLAARAKLKQAIAWIKNQIEDGGKLIVFAVHHEIMDELEKELKQVCVRVDGKTSQEKRHLYVHQFQNDKNKKVFLGNIKAAGVGLTLTAASRVAFLELPWTPAELMQAEDRAHRIGQKDSVNIYYLLAEKTIDRSIAQLLDQKRQIVDLVTEGKKTENSALLLSILKNLSNKST